MGRIDYRMLLAALCALSACAHPRAQQPGGTAYYQPPAAPYSRPSAGQGSSQASGQTSQQSPDEEVLPDEPSDEPEEAQAAPPDTRSSSRDRGPHHLAAAGPGVSAGMPVQTEAGSPLGFVVDVLPGAAGTEESGYVVIVGSSEATTPVPYAAARDMVRDGSVVIDHARFAGAPKVKQSQIEDPSATAWKAQADSYWKGGSAPAPGTAPGSSDKAPTDKGPKEEDAPQIEEEPPRMDSDADSTSTSEAEPEPLPPRSSR